MLKQQLGSKRLSAYLRNISDFFPSQTSWMESMVTEIDRPATVNSNLFLMTCWHLKSWALTFGFVVFPRGSPANAGFVLIQVKESDQSLLLALQFGHLSASLHGAHTSLDCRTRTDETRVAPLLFIHTVLSCTH